MDQVQIISPLQAFILGIVEGISEYLPISSTGHLVIASDFLGLRNFQHLTAEQIHAVQAFEIVIQSGAILAVLVLYRKYFYEIFLGLMGRSSNGRRLLINVCCATMPILIAGFLLKDLIGEYLQFTKPVVFALVVGGLVMIAFERFQGEKLKRKNDGSIFTLHWQQALAIGGMQCLALWPGTSRSMVTIIGGIVFGLSRPGAAEFSFVIGLPALLAATVFKLAKDGNILFQHVSVLSLVIGFLTSTIFAMLAVKWLVSFLNRNGLAVFGWYRLAFGALIAIVGI